MNYFKLFILCLLILILGFQRVQAEVGTRALGMGGAFVAVSDDYLTIFWNPAGIVYAPGREITYFHNYQTSQSTYRTSLINPDEGAGSFALTWSQDQDTKNRLGILSYAQKIGRFFSFGVNYKYIRKEVEEVKGTGLGWDLGILFKFTNQFSLAAVLYDFEDTEIEKDDILKETIKEKVSMGIAIRPTLSSILTLDFQKEQDTKEEILAGLEMNFADGSSVRVGIREEELTAGLGYRLGKFYLDYAYLKVDQENTENLISVSLKF